MANLPASQHHATVDLYLLGGLIFTILTLFLLLMWCCYVLRMRKKRNDMTSEYKVVSSDPAPKIKVNTVEFTVPQSPSRHRRSLPYTPDSRATDARYDPIKPNGSFTNEWIQSQSGDGVETAVGRLRPELYNVDGDSDVEMDDFPRDHIGRLWFRLEYDCEAEKLIVLLKRVKNLPVRQQRSSLSLGTTGTCDPFVRCFLLPDEKRYLQSKMKRKTRNPKFKETFIFMMSYSILRDRTLRFTVYDVDRFMRQSVVGHVLYPLNELDITCATEEFRDLERASQPLTGDSGELQVALCYFESIKRLSVTVLKARDLRCSEITQLDPYVKVTASVLNKVIKSKRTGIQRATNNPTFNQTFEFKLDPDETDRACVTLEVMQSTSPVLKQDKLLGRVMIGGPMCSRGKPLEHWLAMMASQETLIKEYHTLTN